MLTVGETTAVRVLEEMGKVVGRVMVQAAETVLVVEALVAEVQVQGVDPGADLVVGLVVGLVQVVVLAQVAGQGVDQGVDLVVGVEAEVEVAEEVAGAESS